MRFAMQTLGTLDSVAALPGCEEVNVELIDRVFAEAAKFAREVLDPLNRSGDRQGAHLTHDGVNAPEGFADAYRRFVAAGWQSLSGSPEFGGQGLPQLVAMAVQEMWVSANMSFALAPMLTSGVLEALRLHAHPEQRELYLPKLVSGEWTGTMNLTEPQAGSDLSAIRTRATAAGDHYRIQGTKIFITWGEHDMAENIVHLVLARTPGAPEGVKGISLFIVPRLLVECDGTLRTRNDVRCVSIEHKLGIHGSPTCVLAYGEGEGAVGYLVGEVGRGLEYMFTVMNLERLGAGIQGVSIAERSYQHAVDYARTRIQGRQAGQRSGERVAIIQHPDVRRMLMTMRAQTEAMRALAYYAAAVLDNALWHPDADERRRGQARIDLLTPIVKGWCTEQAVEIASTGVQVHGGMGFIEETGAAQYLRDARITTIYEGTTGIQANDLVGRKIAYDRGAAAFALMAEMRAEATAGSIDRAAHGKALSEALDQLEEATRWIVANYAGNANAVAGVSVPYLKLFGTVAGAWLMASSARIARAKLSARGANRDFLSAKIATSRFYAEHILPHATAFAATVLHGADSTLALDEDSF